MKKFKIKSFNSSNKYQEHGANWNEGVIKAGSIACASHLFKGSKHD